MLWSAAVAQLLELRHNCAIIEINCATTQMNCATIKLNSATIKLNCATIEPIRAFSRSGWGILIRSAFHSMLNLSNQRAPGVMSLRMEGP